MFRILSLCLLLVCLASTGLSATIRSIAIRQDSGPTVEQAFVRTHLVSKVGDTFDPFRLTRDVEALYDTGRFSYVGVELASPRDQEEVDLVYHIRARLLLEGSPSIIGNDKLRDGKVQDLLNLDRLDLIDDQILAVRAQKVRDEYRDKLFPDAKVTWEIRELTEPKGHAEVTFTIDEGKKSKIGSVTFDGNEVYDDGDLRPHLLAPPRWRMCSTGRCRALPSPPSSTASALRSSSSAHGQPRPVTRSKHESCRKTCAKAFCSRRAARCTTKAGTRKWK